MHARVGRLDVALESGASAAVPAPPRPAYAITPLIAVVMLAVTLIAGEHYGIGLRDPDGVVGGRLLLVLGLILAFCALDVVPRAILDARATSRPAMRRIIALAHDRWSWQRLVYVLGSIVAFYVIYLCYRNVKSYLPLARPELFDGQLASWTAPCSAAIRRSSCTSGSARASRPTCSRPSTCCS